MGIAQEIESSRNRNSNGLAEVFSNVDLHLTIANIIQKHLVNGKDIRETALENLNLSEVRKIIDLGCGFGFFTRGLKGKVHKKAEITGLDRHSKNKEYYLNACHHSDLNGNFLSDGISYINSIDDNTFDLAICSYALYFFPDYINEISRVLKNDGIFCTITHAKPHMKEFTSYVKSVLKDKEHSAPDRLPYEELVDNFSNENGERLLSKYFNKVVSKKVRSSLLFTKENYSDFEKYFRFKQSFFIPGNEKDQEVISNIILKNVKQNLISYGQIQISKEDMIFICTEPSI